MTREAAIFAPDLTSVLARVRFRLVARQALRALAEASLLAGVAVSCTALVFVLLPRLLGLDIGALETGAVVASAAAGAVAGIARALRGYSVPGPAECAILLENSAQPSEQALSTLVGLPTANVFRGVVAGRARRAIATQLDLEEAVSTSRLVMAPVLSVAAVVLLLVCYGIDPAADPHTLTAHTPDGPFTEQPFSALAAGAQGDQADREAFARAANLRTAAASLRNAAEAVRNTKADTKAISDSLASAKAALDGLADPDREAGAEAAASLDVTPGPAPEDREAAAGSIESAADTMEARAKRLEERGRKGTRDSGVGAAEEETLDPKKRYIVVPPMEPTKRHVAVSDSLATQTPERREMAARAVELLGRIEGGTER